MSAVQFRHALVRKPSPKYASHYAPHGIQISDAIAQTQHDAYVDALKSAGLDITALPPHPTHHDCVFIEDTAIIFEDRALITRMNDLREGEQRDVEPWLAERFKITHPPFDARIEGGDVLHLEDITLVGRSARTNDPGIEALRQFMKPFGHKVIPVPVTRCLHLKSAITDLGERSVLISPALIDLELPAGYQKIEVDPHELHAGNVLRINNCLICSRAFPATNQILKSFAAPHSLRLIELDISEAQKGDGALTCQSILW